MLVVVVEVVVVDVVVVVVVVVDVVVMIVVVEVVVVVEVDVEAAVVVLLVVDGPVPKAKGSQITPGTIFTSAHPSSRMVRSASHACAGSLHVAPRKAMEMLTLAVTANHVAPPSMLL